MATFGKLLVATLAAAGLYLLAGPTAGIIGGVLLGFACK